MSNQNPNLNLSMDDSTLIHDQGVPVTRHQLNVLSALCNVRNELDIRVDNIEQLAVALAEKLTPSKPVTRTAYECFRLNGSRYQNRQVLAVFWKEEDAIDFQNGDKGMKVGKLHMVCLNGNWHRYYVNPYQIKGAIND